MRYTDYLAVLATIASLASATPIEKRDGKTFSFFQSVSRQVQKNGPVALAGVYQKYNKTVPENVAAAASNDGSATATPESYDESYLVPVTIGGQTLNLDFDTGSADLWVFSSELPSSEQAGHTVYNPSKSSTAKVKSGYTWSISYGDGSSASGNVYTDTVNVGGTVVSGQAVELAKKVSSEFVQDTQNDGLLGLAFSSINTVQPQQQNTFFANAAPSLNSPLFTADLKHDAPGSYDFGYIDSSKYTGSITYTSVDNSQGFWQITASGYGVGSSYTSSSFTGIADTGTTLLLLPDNVVSAYYAEVSGAQYDNSQGGYTFPCSASLPSFTLGIGGYKSVVPGSYINYAPVSGSTCFGGIQSDDGIGFSIFGDIWLKSQFIVFSQSGPQLGVAAKNL
ncbi:aspartic protease pepA [Xylona heveae TC161]|uniref:Aspartic protease pepA n=1 Tax=Xylona heveae (strain CBS 132557 / TC161) TaxID=1328760 RepID=A0A165HVI8_XYLHT|nr:aspartic protease pepA [Xylona heveae TC161]KZF23980.1 aspartic protease pepA [Xylona heveae TC161]